MNIRKKMTGFTIVELLIVIVVIAVLASVTVVSFNGIQQRAEQDRTEAIVVAYMKSLEMYYSEHGVYPIPAYPYARICLGMVEDYPAGDGYAAGQCYKDSGAPTVFGSADNAINAQISKYSSILRSNAPLKPATLWWGGGTLTQRGIGFTYLNEDWYSIVYLIPGNQTCTNRGTQTESNYMASQNVTGCVVYYWH